MARDSQLAGDRVQTEYYLQYADHYFRVLGESRARFEEQNPRRQRDDADEDEGHEELAEVSESEAVEADERPERVERFNRRNRQRRPTEDDEPRHAEPAREADQAQQMNGPGETIPFDVLPPAIGRDEPVAEEAEAPRPRRRSRAARPAEDDDEIAPAA